MKKLVAALLALVLCSSIAVAVPQGQSPPFVAPSPLTDIGTQSQSGLPFVIACMGQSNAEGFDSLGSKTVAANVYISNSLNNPTAFIPAAFGTAPLNSALGGTTTNPALAYNNQCVAMANDVANSGLLAPGTPIIILPNWFPGQSITNWVAAGTSSTYWGYFQLHLNLLQLQYPGAFLNYVVWDQAENDCASCSTAYNTFATYQAGFATLLTQMQATPQWNAERTLFGATELAPWVDNSTLATRNDFLSTIRNGSPYPQVTMVPGGGLTESIQNPGPHYDGNSLITLGQRHFESWLSARVGGHFGGLANSTYPPTGGQDAIVPALVASGQAYYTASISGTTMTVSAVASGTLAAGELVTSPATLLIQGTRIVTQLTGSAGGTGTYQVNNSQTVGSEAMVSSYGLDPGVIKNGATVVNNFVNGYISFAHPVNFGTRSPTIRFLCIQTCVLDFNTFGGTSGYDERVGSNVQTATVLPPDEVDVRPVNGVWRVTPVYPARGVVAQNAGTALADNTPLTISNRQQFGNLLLTSRNALTITPGPGSVATIVNLSSVAATTIAITSANEVAGARVIEPDGTVRDTGVSGANPYPVQPGATVTYQTDSGFNLRILTDSSRANNSFQTGTGGSPIICNVAAAELTLYVQSGTTVSNQAITLPTNPANGQRVTVVTQSALSAITWTGTTGPTVPSTLAAGARVTLSYSTALGGWY